MTKYIHEGGPDPDAHVKDQLAKQAQRALDMAQRRNEAPPLSEEQLEREAFQAASNEAASSNPLYSAARSASAHFLVVPLEPNGTKPLIDPSKATRDDRTLFAWWEEWPEANPGVALGRVGGIWALEVKDDNAAERLREMTVIARRDADTDRSWLEDMGIGGAVVRLVAPPRPFSMRARGGWGRAFDQAAAELERESQNRNPQRRWLVWSYPSIVSGQDAYNFPNRTVGAGLKVIGEGALPWGGSILDGATVVAPSSPPPEAPLWVARMFGKARSRRAMQAAREQYETDLRAINAYWEGVVRAQKTAGEEALRLALAEREKAARAAQEAE